MTEQFVAGYLDGELDLVRKIEMEEHLQSCAGCARELESLRSVRASLRRGGLAYSAPAGLRERIHAALPASSLAEAGAKRRGAAGRLQIWQWAAAFALAAACVFAAWRILPPQPAGGSAGGPQLAAEIFASHLRSLEANHLLDVVSTDQHTVKPWFDGKLKFSPPVVDLASAGFPLIGGRLDYLEGHEVAALIYQKRQHYINVFVWPAASGGAPSPGSQAFQGYFLRSWSENGFEFWAVSDVNQDDLATFVRLLQSQMP